MYVKEVSTQKELHSAQAGMLSLKIIPFYSLESRSQSYCPLLKRVKENPQTAHIPVIINSSMSSDSNKQMAQALRADAFITKSNPIEIEQALKKLLKH